MLNQKNYLSYKKYNKFLIFIIFICIVSLMLFVFKVLHNSIPVDNNIIDNSNIIDSTFPEPSIKLIEEPMLFPKIVYMLFYDIALTENYLNIITNVQFTLNTAIVSERYSISAIDLMITEYDRLQELYYKISKDLTRLSAWEGEYYYAARTYEFLRQNGYNDAVTCGIIGNMMVETSGGTMALKPDIYNSSGNYYGLCQWSLKYYPDAEKLSFEQQLNFLLSNIVSEFNTFGKLYANSFNYNDFLNVTDPAEAAYIFAVVYERCAPISYEMRRESAVKAYEYFNLNS